LKIKYFLTLIFAWLIVLIGSSQNTFVPDDNFEQALIDLGYDKGPLDDYVPTVKISYILILRLENKNISDLTGIEDFTSLGILDCEGNNLTSVDLSKIQASFNFF